MKRKPIIIILVSIITGILASALLVHLSPWYSWYLLPEGPTKLVIRNSKFPDSVINQALLFGESDLGHLKLARQIGISKQGESMTLMVTPKHPLLFKDYNLLKGSLAKDGWSVSRHGFLVVAHKGADERDVNPSLQAFVSSYRQLIFQKPRRVLAAGLIESGQSQYIKHPVAFTVTFGDAGSFKINIADTFSSLISKEDNDRTEIGQVDQLSIAIPGEKISLLPKEILDSWNGQLSERLMFTDTDPDFMGHLMNYREVAIQSDSNFGTAISVNNNPKKFIDTIKLFVQSEEAYSRLKRKAFRLPDGTLGYELVPGVHSEVFLNSTGSFCRDQIWEEKHLWVCVRGEKAAFGTTEAITSKMIEKNDDAEGSVSLFIQDQEIAESLLPSLKYLNGYFNEKRASITVKFSQ